MHLLNVHGISFPTHLNSYNLPKRRYQSLCQPEAKDKFRSRHEQLRRQSLEEASHALILGHVAQDPEPALGILKVSVLDPGLDDVERSGDDEGGGCADYRGHEVLHPARGVVVGELVDVFFGKCRATEELLQLASADRSLEMGTYGKRARSVSSRSPSRSPV